MPYDILKAVCGPRCDRCPAYVATKAGDRDALERIAREWTEGLGRLFTATDVTCDGCRVEGARLSAYCADCEIRNCAASREAETCADCGDCPCEKIVAPQAKEALAEIKASLLKENR